MNLTKTEKQILKSKIKFGDIARVARMVKKSRSTVNRWLKDENNSPEITQAFGVLLQRREIAVNSLRKRLSNT